MRLMTLAIVTATLLAAVPASATDQGKGGPGPGNAPGGAGQGGGSSEGASTGVNAGERLSESGANPDVANGIGTSYKPWEVGAIFTTHRLLIQGDQTGADLPDGQSPAIPAGGAPGGAQPGSGSAVNKQVNDYEFYARYDITKHDRVGVNAYVFEYFLADQGENGVRFDDMVFTYTHSFDLPKKFRLQASLWVTAPTSYTSQLEGLVTFFRPILELDRRFGPVSLDFRTYDTIFVQRYDSWAGSGGEAPTELNTFAMTFDAEFHMPFHEPLSLGAGIFDAYTWYHNIGSGITAGNSPVGNNTSGNSTKNEGLVNDGSQPISQSYGWDAYLRYLLPDLVGVKSDLTLAYSFGDPVVGYSSVLQDGVGHVFLGYRHNSEMYLTLAVRY
jgi:hypothetical protein